MEAWKDIRGYEGLYQVSNRGNVRSLNYRNSKKVKNLTPKINNCGRLWVELANGGTRKAHLIHRLVAEAFIPNSGHYPEVNHKDENPKNNAAENLEWCTGEYNRRYSHERHPERHSDAEISATRNGRKNGRATSLKIDQFSLDGTFIQRWPNSRTILHHTGMSDWSIAECCRGKRKQAYGYKWQYAISYTDQRRSLIPQE